MRTWSSNNPGDGHSSEDLAVPGPDMSLVLDGVSAPTGTGCVHSTAWFVDHLAYALVDEADDRSQTLPDAVAAAIRRVRAMHAECDLDRGGPAAAVGIVRRNADQLEYALLADVTLVVRSNRGGVVTVVDDRVDAALDPDLRTAARTYPIGSNEQRDAVAAMSSEQLKRRNVEGGYWVAADDPGAGRHALTDSYQLDRVQDFALLTDGAAAIADVYTSLPWEEVMHMLATTGTDDLLARVRRIEQLDPHGKRWPRFKAHDDATIAYTRIADREDEVRTVSTPQGRLQVFADEVSEGVTVISHGMPRLVVATRPIGSASTELTFVDGTTRICRPTEMVSIAIDVPPSQFAATA